MQAQWDRAAGTPGNGRRRMQASPRVNGLFTRGSAGGGPARATLQDKPYGLQDVIPVRMASRPYRDAEYVPAGQVYKIKTCPGCGIQPPRNGHCDYCWD